MENIKILKKEWLKNRKMILSKRTNQKQKEILQAINKDIWEKLGKLQ